MAVKDGAAALLNISQNDDDKLGVNTRSVLKLCNESLGRVLFPIRLSAISNAVELSIPLHTSGMDIVISRIKSSSADVICF